MRYVGEFVGEASLLKRMAAGASCITHTWCELMLLRRADFKVLVKKHPDLLERVSNSAKHKDDSKMQLVPNSLLRSPVPLTRSSS